MKTINLWTILLLLWKACSQKQADQNIYVPVQVQRDTSRKINPTDTLRVKSNILDSLNKYSDADSNLIVNRDEGLVIFIGKANQVSFALASYTDSLIFYQKVNHQWKVTNRILETFPFSFLRRIDINGDNAIDVVVSSYSGANGNSISKVFLFDALKQEFRHNHHFDLANIQYDKINKFIKSWWFAGVVHCQSKAIYKISGDSLVMEMIVHYCPKEFTILEYGKIEYIKMINGKETVIKSQEGKSEIIWKQFCNALWKTGLD